MEIDKKTPTIKTILNIVENIIIIFLLSITVILSYLAICNIGKDKPPSVMGYSIYIVLSGSMNPSFDTGSLIVSKSTPVEEIKVKDVITFKDSKSEDATTHRIVEIKEDDNGVSYITKGDANEVNDPKYVPYEDVLGVVKMSIPKVGGGMKFLNEKIGVYILAPLIGGILIIHESIKIIKIIKKDKSFKE